MLRSLGILLLTAAALKAYGFTVSSLPTVGLLSSPPMQAAAVVWECLLGLWLVSGAARWLAWLAASTTFGLFAAISLTLAVQGVADCGCFGAIKASPWWAFGVDVLALTCLAVARPAFAMSLIAVRPVALASVTAASVIIVTIAAGIATFGSLSATVANLRGERLHAPSYLDFGSAQPGQLIERSATITNYSRTPVRLVGGTADCSCVTTSSFPLTIEPGESVEFAVKLRVPDATNAGRLTRTAEIWTDNDDRRTIRLRLGVSVKP